MGAVYMSIRDDLNYGLAAFGVQIPTRINLDAWSEKLTDSPARNTLAVVGASALLFYQFERAQNPKVNDITDALLYCSTCLSVGYADIQPVTKAGKLLGSLLMTYGPSLAVKTVDGEKRDEHGEIMATLRNIATKLETFSPART